MIGWLIVACEVGFWFIVLLGLVTRYVLRLKKLGAVLLMLTPVVDLVLLGATVIDIRGGADVSFVHGLSAVYIGATVSYGHRMIKWADERFAYRFADGPEPKRQPKAGPEHAALERAGWYRHLLAWTIGSALLAGMILLIGDMDRAEALRLWIVRWAVILGIDFAISFSYTLWPRKSNKKVHG
ncbi:hypothetical protein QWJ34_24120 [Saccharibacillus sp. CPCC 101409]|uniref:hypothetical protein n=1 Tax=Saccharibacillus sp. CPCC 101409 TaxID=3058041 RepID=UPI002671AFC2|nr:hypothetical protein [Saccharibacillus sp. CPCC 101409]MDO3412874.1 hypothetical protein [Saccharibacillus sp. CPCC 101409]